MRKREKEKKVLEKIKSHERQNEKISRTEHVRFNF